MPFPFPFGDGPEEPGNIYTIGQMPRVSVEFTVVATEAPIDPDNVFLDVTTPSNVTTTYEYGTDPEIVKDSTGNYHADIDANELGNARDGNPWRYRWYSTGTGQAADSKTFDVEE